MVFSLAVVAADGVPLEQALHLSKSTSSLGAVVQLHGINADMNEGGMYVRLADRLAEVGFGVLRFSFRGHGGSGGTQQGATIAGEQLDLQAAIEAARTVLDGPISLVASSFGAVSLCLSLPYLEAELRSLVLWNPVLDLHRTFVEPVLPWGVENFGPEQQALLSTQRFLSVDGEFEVGRVLFEEMRRYLPREKFVASRIPALVVHGDRDTGGADVVIGFGATVIGGVRVGPRSYVTAGAIVTRDVPPGYVVTGINTLTLAADWQGGRLRELLAHWQQPNPPPG